MLFYIVVLLAVFHYLDDISLWHATKVCVRWRNILNAELCGDQWKEFIDRRWPLFQPQYNVSSWKMLYNKMYVFDATKMCTCRFSDIFRYNIFHNSSQQLPALG